MADVLLVDDDEAFASATSELLALLGHNVDLADSVTSARKQLSKNIYDRVFLDLILPDGSGFHILEYIPMETKGTKVTIITGHPSIKTHVMSLYGMNVNYLAKPINLKQLKRLFEADDAASESSPKKHFNELIGETENMHSLYEMIKRVASSKASVMLFGESGCGKDVVARAIHNAGTGTGPLVATNCGAFSNELIGSELFGHEKGAFTGAVSRKIGVFEQANNGTLFLDEITEMPLSLQPTLLRVLETQTVTRVGGSTTIPVNCRVISATNMSDAKIVESKCLREDLYYRLAVFPILVPPLRDRLADVPLLARSFLSTLNRENGTAFDIKEEDLKRLTNYDWPGNVRELRHTVHRAYIMTRPEDSYLNVPRIFSSPFSRKAAKEDTLGGDLVGNTIEEIERKLIKDTLAKYNNNKTKAAEVLGVSVKTLYNRLNSYEESDEKQA